MAASWIEGARTGANAAGQQRHPAFAGPRGGKTPPTGLRWRHRAARRSQAQHCGDRSQVRARAKHAGKRLAHTRGSERPAQSAIVRKHVGPDIPRMTRCRRRPPICLLDMDAGMVDQVHVVHARGTGGHAGKTGKAAIDVPDDFGCARPAALQHVLDQVDAPARGIELIPKQHVGRTGRSAEAAMNAGAQDSVRLPRYSGSASWASGERGLA